jgi:hypothetical protein
MPASLLFAPTDSRIRSRRTPAHTHAVPVVREIPRPHPGRGGNAW